MKSEIIELPGFNLTFASDLIKNVCVIYFFFHFKNVDSTLKRIKAREQVQYGILEDSEFELRHLELSDDSEDDDDPTLYTSRKNIRRPNKQY